MNGEGEREGDTGRDTERVNGEGGREGETDRQPASQTETETEIEKHKYRKRERQTNGGREKETETDKRQTVKRRQTERHTLHASFYLSHPQSSRVVGALGTCPIHRNCPCHHHHKPPSP